MSGRASMTVRSRASAPSKSGMRTSMPMPGLVSRIRRIVSAKIRDAAVGQVVAGDAGDDDVLQAEGADRLGDATRLVVVEPGGPAGLHGAEAAGARARVAEDHDRRRALVPALADVRAAGLLADGVEVQAAEQALEVVVVLAGRHPGADPVGMAAEGGRAVGSRRGRRRHRTRSRAARRVVTVTAAGRARRSGARALTDRSASVDGVSGPTASSQRLDVAEEGGAPARRRWLDGRCRGPCS